MIYRTLFLLSMFAPCAMAQEPPTSGMLTGKSDRDFLEYTCEPPDTPVTVKCKFTQLSIRKKAKPEDLVKKIEKLPEAVASFADAKDKPDCKDLVSLEQAIATNKLPHGANVESFTNFQSLEPREKADTLSMLRTVRDVCLSPTAQNIEKLMRAEHDKDTRTCILTSNSFEQSFTLSSGQWVHNNGPHGDCGLIYITKLVREDGLGAISFFRYTTRKVVTNKSKTFGTLGMKCSDLDENEYVYDWREMEVYRGCDYIRYLF